jgi:hypothetical protein
VTAPRVLAVWSAPRSRSTAFYRAILQRGDVLALHEPFCNIIDHGETTVGDRTVHRHPELIAELWRRAAESVVLFKDTTDYEYAAVFADRRFLAEAQHTFLLRRPEEIVASHFALNPELSTAEVGVEMLHRLHAAVRAAGGRAPLVVDSDDLVDRPAATMRAWCAAVGLPARDDALSWEAGGREEWGRSSRWHRDVESTRGFARRDQPYAETVETNPRLAELAGHHRPFYDDLLAQRLLPA